ncbi:MAG: hypothetical protein ACRENP_24415 [Longimicrobiales bacterium]
MMMNTRGRWRIVLAASSLLALGAVAGVAVDRLMPRHHDPRMIRLARVHADPLGSIDRLVALRPEQRERIAAILKVRQSAVDDVWRDTHLRLQATIDSVLNEIAAVLDAEQAARFRAAARELHRSDLPLHLR